MLIFQAILILVAAAESAELPPALQPPPGVVAPKRLSSPMPAEEGVIVNYWQHVKELYAAHGEQPTRYQAVAPGKYPSPRHFTVESFAHLRAKDLLRAAEEGATEARAQGVGKPVDEVDRQVLENVGLALEYYPLLARKEEDAKALFILMESGGADPVLRNFLIRRTVAEMAPNSVFAYYVREQAIRHSKDVKRILRQTVESQSHANQVRPVALEALYHFYCEDLRRVLERDQRLLERATKEGAVLDVQYLKAHPDLSLAPDLKNLVDHLCKQAEELAGWLVRQLAVRKDLDPDLRAVMLSVLERMHENFPLGDIPKLQEVLAAG